MRKLIRIPFVKSVLYLTKEEFLRALKRGRAIERARRAKKRAEKRLQSYEKALTRVLGQGPVETELRGGEESENA